MQNNSGIKLTTLRNSKRNLVDIGYNHFKCDFCNKHLSTETGFLNHQCDKMKRFNELKSITGQNALILYNKWLSRYGLREQNPYTFIKSKNFRSLIKFADFVKKSRFKHIDRFIRWAISNNYPPSMWLLPEVYGSWSAYYLKDASPLELVQDTIEVLEEIADDAGVDLSKIFQIMSPHEVVHLVCYQQLSPWAILNSPKFKKFYIKQITGSDRVRFDAFVDGNRWMKTFLKFPKQHSSIKKLMIDIGL